MLAEDRGAWQVAVLLCLVALGGGACRGRGNGEGETDSGLPPGAVAVTPTTPLNVPTSGPGSGDRGDKRDRAGSDLAKSGPLSFAPIAKAADRSVVTITTVGEEVEASRFSGRLRRRETKGLGTGFIIDKAGTILTNNHVVEGAIEIRVKLSDDSSLPARIVGRDPRTDIAIVKIDAAKDAQLAALPLGDSDAIDVGDWAVAIGNPFGLSHTVSAGIISAKGRSREDVPLDPSGYYNFLQTDASINPGNSGGPLLNLRAEVVGINTAIRGGGAQGIGFAIPINMVKQLLPMLLRDGHVTRSAIGVIPVDVHELSPKDKEELKIAEDKGTVIAGVTPNSPAQRAGLEAGDIILAFDGTPIERGNQLKWLASTAGVGRTVTLRCSRAGKAFDAKVTLGLLPDPQETAPPPLSP